MSVRSEVERSDLQRKHALDLACIHTERNTKTPEQLVVTAQTFFEFLSGKTEKEDK